MQAGTPGSDLEAELTAAAEALALASSLLSVSIWKGSDELIENAYAQCRAATARLRGVMAEWHDARGAGPASA